MPLDPAGIIDGWNSAAERVLGYSAAEILGRPYMRLLPSDAAELPLRSSALDVALGRPEADVTLVRHDGTPFAARLSWIPLCEGDELLGFVLFVHDVMERR